MGDGFEVEAVLVKREETVPPETDAISNEEEACFDSYQLRYCCMRFERTKLFILFFCGGVKASKG